MFKKNLDAGSNKFLVFLSIGVGVILAFGIFTFSFFRIMGINNVLAFALSFILFFILLGVYVHRKEV